MLTLPVPPPETPLAEEQVAAGCARGEEVSEAQGLPTTGRQGLGQGVLTVLCQAVSSATTLLRMVLLMRVVGSEQVGLYSMAMTPILLAFAVQERLIESSYLVYAYRRTGVALRSWLGNSIVISLSFCGVATLLTLLWALGCIAWGMSRGEASTQHLGLALLAATLVMAPTTFREFARSVSFAHFDIVSATIIDFTTLLVQVALLGACWWFGVVNVTTCFLALGVSSLIACGWWLVRMRPSFVVERAALAADVREMWNFSKWLVLARTLGQGSRFIMPWIVWCYLGEAAAGVLATCITLVGLSWIFVRGVNNYFRPIAVRAFLSGGAPAVRSAVRHTSWVFLLLCGGLCGLYFVVGDKLFALVYGPGPQEVWLLVLLMGVNTLLTSLAIAATNGLAAIERPQGNTWIEGLTFAVTAATAPWLTLHYGLAGAAWAMLLGNLVGAISAYWLFERELRAARAEDLR